MGNAASDNKDSSSGESVILNVYDGKDTSNMPTLGFGVYHTGLQVHGTEYVFDGGQTLSSGIRAQKPLYLPKECDWKFKESITIGTTKFTKPQVQEIVNQMKPDYTEKSYHITAKNCNHFTDDLSMRLTGKNIPGWVNRVAKAGNLFKGVVDSVMSSQPSAPTTAPVATAPTEHIDLSAYIESSACLNETKEHPLSSIFSKSNKKAFLESDADEQLLIFFNFKQNLKIFSILLAGPEGNAPKGVKLFVNKKNMDFSDAETAVATQELTLTESQAAGEAVPLKYVNFQNVVSLTVFIASNQGNKDSTMVSKIQFVGVPVNVTNMQNLKEVQYRGDLE